MDRSHDHQDVKRSGIEAIDRIGVARMAKTLGINRQAVRKWRRTRRVPDDDQEDVRQLLLHSPEAAAVVAPVAKVADAAKPAQPTFAGATQTTTKGDRVEESTLSSVTTSRMIRFSTPRIRPSAMSMRSPQNFTPARRRGEIVPAENTARLFKERFCERIRKVEGGCAVTDQLSIDATSGAVLTDERGPSDCMTAASHVVGPSMCTRTATVTEGALLGECLEIGGMTICPDDPLYQQLSSPPIDGKQQRIPKVEPLAPKISRYE